MASKKKSVLVAEPAQGYRIEHAYGDRRKQAQEYLRLNHYMASDGNQGFMFSITADDDAVAGACLVGNAMSQNAELDLLGGKPRSKQGRVEQVTGACLVGQSGSPDIEGDILDKDAVGRVLVQQIKRSHILDDVPATAVCESKLLRRSIQYVTAYYRQPVLFVSYADPSAKDSRNGSPLLGGVYMAAGGFHVGKTGPRKVVLDHEGKWRSTKQGKLTLTQYNLPKRGDLFGDELVTKDWEIFVAEPAMIWIFICTPSFYTQKQAKRAWREVWSSLNPERRVAAKIWVDEVQWGRDQRGGILPLGEPKPEHVHDNQRFQPAEWPGERITRTAAPAWPGFIWQNKLVFEEDIADEVVANRVYLPTPMQLRQAA